MTTNDTEIASIPGLGQIVTVDNTPHPADIIAGQNPFKKFAVAVTEDHGLQVKELVETDEFLPNPVRTKGTRTVADIPSFLAELARRPLHGTASTLWGNAERGIIHAVYNDHDGDTAGWRDDQLTLQLKKDADWVAWHNISGTYMRQQKFGDLVEELRHTIVSPDQADLLEIIDSVRASTKGEFESTVQRANGGQKLTYKVEVSTRAGTAGRELAVPQNIQLALRPWEGHPKLYTVPAYFRLDISEGALSLAIKLFPTREVLREAWTDLTQVITEAVGKPVYAQP